MPEHDRALLIHQVGGWGDKKKRLAAFALVTGSWYHFEERFLEDCELAALLV